MRPSVTSATFWPRSSSTPSTGVSLCSSGMPFAFGPWWRTTTTTSPVNSPASKAWTTACWLSKTRHGASTTRCSCATADTLTIARPRLPSSRRNPPSFWNGASGRRSTPSSRDCCGGGFGAKRPCASSAGSASVSASVEPQTVSALPSISPASASQAPNAAVPPAAWKWFTSAVPFG